MQIYPSILTDSITVAQQQLDLVNASGRFEAVQIDIIDGLFADNTTITSSDLPTLEAGELQFDLHLMTEEPLDFVYETIEFASEIPVRAIIAQVERMSSQEDFIDTVKKRQWQVGLSLNLFTPLEAIDDLSWHDLDIIQIMSIEAGVQGQVFQQKILQKITALRKKLQQLDIKPQIVVDGGVKVENLQQLHDLGVYAVTPGSAFWQASDAPTALHEFANAAEALEPAEL